MEEFQLSERKPNINQSSYGKISMEYTDDKKFLAPNKPTPQLMQKINQNVISRTLWIFARLHDTTNPLDVSDLCWDCAGKNKKILKVNEWCGKHVKVAIILNCLAQKSDVRHSVIKTMFDWDRRMLHSHAAIFKLTISMCLLLKCVLHAL